MMVSYLVSNKTKPKWQLLGTVCVASALPELFQFQVNLGTVNSSKTARLCLEEQWVFEKALTDLFCFSSLSDVQIRTLCVCVCVCGIEFHCKRAAQFTSNIPAVLHSPDVREDLVTSARLHFPTDWDMQSDFLSSCRWLSLKSRLGLPSGVLPPSRSRLGCRLSSSSLLGAHNQGSALGFCAAQRRSAAAMRLLRILDLKLCGN